jgi:tetratricopeptide (TPR) repeat protein
VAVAERALPELTGPDQLAWHARLEDELENLRAARDWCRRDPGGAEPGLRLAAALGRYWQVRAPRSEGRLWLAQALADGTPEPTAARARALTWCGQLDYLHGEADAGRARLEEAVRVARRVGDGSLLCLTLRHLALYAADPATAPTLLTEAIDVARVAGDRRELALALSYLGTVREQQGDRVAAAGLYGEAIVAGRASGDGVALSDALHRHGGLDILRGRFDAAQSALEEALELSQALAYRNFVTLINRQLAQLALERGDLGAARARVRSSLEMARESSNGAEGLRPLQLAARLAVASGGDRHAARLLGAVAGWLGRHAVQPDTTLWARWSLRGDDDTLVAARANLGEQAFEAAWAEGLRLSLDDALDDALAAEGRAPDPVMSGR